MSGDGGGPERAEAASVLPLDRLDAVVFDLDGVLTETARLHLETWKEMFDRYLEERAEAEGGTFRPFTSEDYRRWIDGKPRYEGTQSFLASRGIALPRGSPEDPPGAETVCGLGNRKNALFQERLEAGEVVRYEGSVALVRELRERGVPTGVISSSRNCRAVLRAAGIEALFDVRVDGTDVAAGLAGKPEPDLFLEAVRRLGVSPARTAVIEDALSGVEAGRRGGFALVVGVDRTGHPEELRRAGADVVVGDPGELRLQGGGEPRPIRELPSALERVDEIEARLAGRRPILSLDYDGTLTPIVEDPDRALLPEPTRETLRRLADDCTVAVVSGRDLADVRAMVALEGLYYAGSHGFDILGPDVSERRGEEYRPALAEAATELEERLADIPGARVERKRFAIAVHYRRTPVEREAEIERRVAEVTAAHPGLRRTGGKKIWELRPDLEWDKGRALLRLLELLEPESGPAMPVYIGDDVTDEDAFRVVRDRGLALVVRGEDDGRPSLAHYALEDPAAVGDFLAHLAERRGSWRSA